MPNMEAVMGDATVFGRRVRYYRTQIGVTLEDLAARSGVTLVTMFRYESGERFPELRTLVAIANALEVPLDALVDPEGPEPDKPAPPHRPKGKGK